MKIILMIAKMVSENICLHLSVRNNYIRWRYEKILSDIGFIR